MEDFAVSKTVKGFTAKLWRGERMCLIGFDVDEPEDDFVGFAIEFREPKSKRWKRLHNRLNFAYKESIATAVTGFRTFPSTEAPIQKFRWVHFPWEVKRGSYSYRLTKMHMPVEGLPVRGTSITLSISLNPITHPRFLDVGFTRNFASSQAFLSFQKRHKITTNVIPSQAHEGLAFAAEKAALESTGVYRWLGFEAHDLLFDFLKWAVREPSVELDVLVYDFNEPDILDLLERLGPRLRIVMDNSAGKAKASSPESKAAKRLRQSAGAAQVKRGHFQGLQHNKVFIAKKNGRPLRVIAGSTNFTFRGLYIQANNLLRFTDRGVANLFSEMFELAFNEMADFKKKTLAQTWHVSSRTRKPTVHLAFSPHKDSALALTPVGAAIDQATSAVFYSFAFMGQTKSGAVRDALDRLIKMPLFSYGVVNRRNDMEIHRATGDVGLVDFAYLAKNAPEPFRAEWSGGRGINIHHKFVVTDFNKPSAKVYTGSSNFSPTGEKKNGDHMLVIEDQRVATAYAIEALRMFDHLRFRNRMKEEKEKAPKKLTLQKPIAISKRKRPWFHRFYVSGSQNERDRKLFSS